MKKFSVLFFTTVCLFLTTSNINAQFNTPTVDGTISAGEYGSTLTVKTKKIRAPPNVVSVLG